MQIKYNDMINNKNFKLQMQLIINEYLYEKNVINEEIFFKVNEKLLNSLKSVETI